MYFCERKNKNNYREIGNQNFFKALKDSSAKQILLYIHGFNNMEPDVFERTKDLQQLFDKAEPNFIKVVPLIWPCDDDSAIQVVDDHWDDQQAADKSGYAFARLLSKFDDWRRKQAKLKNPCVKRMNILAHSMGNRVLRNALATWSKFHTQRTVPQFFRNTFMVAADVVNHTLEDGEDGQWITAASRNVVVYYANDDLAMPASKLANLKNRTVSRRLGMTGPKSMSDVPKNVFEVDCDDFNNSIDSPKGHSYFIKKANVVSPVFQHMLEAINAGRVTPDERSITLNKPEGLQRVSGCTN